MSDPISPDGVLSWNEPEPLKPRGTVVVLIGRGEDPDLYERLGRRLSADAYRVRVLDAQDDDRARGQLDTLLADPDVVAPVVLLGSDAGAARAVRLVAGNADRADGDAGQAEIRGVVLGGLLPAGAGTASFDDFDAELAARTSCPTHRARLSSDPRFRRNALAVALEPADLEAPLAVLTVPVLALHGSADSVAPAADAVERYRSASDVEVFTVVDGVHDVFNDIFHRVVAAEIVLFLERIKAGRTIVQQLAP